MKKSLKDLGLDLTRQDFTEISPDFPFVSNILHNTFIEIDEKGTEAFNKDRLDDLENSKTNLDEDIITDDFVCDRPFIFIVHHIFSLEIIFIGKLMDPIRRKDCLLD